MTSLKIVGLAAIVATALATPAFAQARADNSARCTGLFQDPNCQNLASGNPTTERGYRRRHMAHRQVNPNDGTQSGFWPLDAAGAAAGAAVGTAGAIATAPFRAMDNSYAYDNRGWDRRSYAQRNGFVCTPGTWFKGEDGRRHMCQ